MILYLKKKKNQVFDWIAHNQLRTTYALVQHPCSRNSCDCKVSLYAQSSYLWYQCWELNRSRNNLCTTRLISSTNTLATCSSSLSRWQWQKLWQRSMELDSRNFKILPSPCYSKFQIGWFNFVIVLKNVYIEPLVILLFSLVPHALPVEFFFQLPASSPPIPLGNLLLYQTVFNWLLVVIVGS